MPAISLRECRVFWQLAHRARLPDDLRAVTDDNTFSGCLFIFFVSFFHLLSGLSIYETRVRMCECRRGSEVFCDAMDEKHSDQSHACVH